MNAQNLETRIAEVRAAFSGIASRPGSPHFDRREWEYLVARFPGVAAHQVSATGTKHYSTPEGIHVQPALRWLGTLA